MGGQGHFGLNEVLLAAWSIFMAVEIELGDVLAMGRQERREADRDSGMALVLGSNTI